MDSIILLIKVLSNTQEFQQSPDAQKCAQTLQNIYSQRPERISPEMGQAVRTLWALPLFQNRFENRSDLQLIDAASYFFNEIDRLSKPDYLPSDQDIVNSRSRTSGLYEMMFKLAGAPLRIVDVGGQRSERRKWIHCFEEVTVIFFIVAISEYDQRLREDDTTNRLKESMSLFDEISNCEWFFNTPIILFLNKSDLFEKKMTKVPLKTFFQDWDGGDNVEKATKFIETKFKSINKNQQRQLFVHVTCATNTENVAFVFRAFQNIFLSKRLNALGFD